MADTDEHFGLEAEAGRLRQIRLAFMNGVDDKRAFANQVKIDESRWGNAERAHNFLSREDLVRLCQATGATVDFIVRGNLQMLSSDLRKKISEVPPREEKPRAKALKRA